VLLSEILEVHESDESDNKDGSISVTDEQEQALVSKFIMRVDHVISFIITNEMGNGRVGKNTELWPQ